MEALRGFLFPVITLITIVFSSRSQSVSNVGKAGENRYRKFITNEEGTSVKNGPILAKLVDKIVELYVPGESLLCILTDDKIKNICYDNALKEFPKLGTRNVISMSLDARKYDSRQVVYQKPTTYFLLGIDLSAVLKTLINFGKFSGTWNPRGLYISTAESREEAVTVMISLWKNFVYKVVVLVFYNKTSVEAYTWRPYYPQNYCGPPTVKNIVRLGEFTRTLEFRKETDTEPGMMPERFGNCLLNVSVNIWEPLVYPPASNQELSLELNLIKMVCEKIGIKINPTFHDLAVLKDANEAWAGTHLPLSEDVELYEISMPYIQDSLLWVVPSRDEIQVFEIADMFPSSLWLPSAIAMSVAAASLLVSGSKHWILWVWGSLWEQSDYKIAKKVRWIWGCWLLLCLHLSVAYKTALVSVLTDPVTEEQIQTQSELLESGLKLGFIPGTELWFDEEDEIEKKILDTYVSCETVIKCYKEIPTGKAVFTNRLFINYLNTQKSEMGSIAERVHLLPASLTYKVTMIFAKGHAVLPPFDKALHLTLQTGFVEYWTKRIEAMQTRIKMHRSNFTREHKLLFSQLRGGFHLLYTGLITAGLFFLYEISYHFLEAKFYRHIKEKYLE